MPGRSSWTQVFRVIERSPAQDPPDLTDLTDLTDSFYYFSEPSIS